MRRVLSGAARIVLFMRPAVAIEELDKLKAEAEATNHFVDKPGIESWKARVRAILVGALGATNNIVEKFDNVRYGLSIAWEGMPDSAWDVGQRGQAPHPETRRREAVRARVLGLGSLLLTQLRHRARGDLEMSDGAKVGSRRVPETCQT